MMFDIVKCSAAKRIKHTIQHVMKAQIRRYNRIAEKGDATRILKYDLFQIVKVLREWIIYFLGNQSFKKRI
jgi:hypothetical protein